MDVHASFEARPPRARWRCAAGGGGAARRRARARAAAGAPPSVVGGGARRRAAGARVWRLPPPSGSWKRAWRARGPRRLGSAMDAGGRRGGGEFGGAAAARRRETTKVKRRRPRSAAEASRKGREGSGWFDALGETAPAARRGLGRRAAARGCSARRPNPLLRRGQNHQARGGSGGCDAPFSRRTRYDVVLARGLPRRRG